MLEFDSPRRKRAAHADYLVVGSGAAAAAFIAEKLHQGASVLMVEAGTSIGIREDFASHRQQHEDALLDTSVLPANPWTVKGIAVA